MNSWITKDDYATLLRKYNLAFKKPSQIKVDPTKEYTEEEMIELIKQLPDGMRFPLPLSWYEKYNISRPEPMSFNEALHNSFNTVFSEGPSETRPPAKGGVREMPVLPLDETTQTDPQPQSQEEVESHTSS
jgi:hypothetical protein